MQDDDSVLDKLLNELDIESAIYRLRRIGFSIVSSPNTKQKYHHLSRTRDEEFEDIFIELNKHNHFLIRYTCEGMMATYPDVVTTWDEWVAFVRLLVLKYLGQKRKTEEPCEDASTKRLKCTEQ